MEVGLRMARSYRIDQLRPHQRDLFLDVWQPREPPVDEEINDTRAG